MTSARRIGSRRQGVLTWIGLPVIVSLALTVAGLAPAVAQPDQSATATTTALDAAGAESFERADRVSAMGAAQVLGQRVEDLSQRDEFSQVFANPDGSWSSMGASEPVRTLDASGAWHDIDTSLVERDGGWAPARAAVDVVLSAGGDKTFAAVTEAGRELDWRWPTALPVPTVAGDTATYADVVPGGDLVVTATATGFAHNIVLREAPAGPVEFTMPVATHGAELVEVPGGGVEVQTPAGDTLVAAPAPVMWDSSTDPGGDPGSVAPVEATIGATAAGTPTLTLAPDAAFLADPGTVYPVTVDPSFTTHTSGDVWVMNQGYTTGQTASTELRAGTYDGGTHVAQTLMHFDWGTDKWAGKDIVSAQLVLRNFDSGSCTSGTVRALRVSQAWAGNTLTWANRPTHDSSYHADYSPAKGYSSACAAADATWNITDMVQAWADGYPNNGIKLKALDETNSNTWRRYRSANYDGGGSPLRPRIEVSWNEYPNTAEKPTLMPGNVGYSTSATPKLSAVVSDPDGSRVAGKFSIYIPGATSPLWTGTSGEVVGRGPVSVNVPAGLLTDGTTYSIRVKSTDGRLDAKSWSPWYSFKVDTTAPGAPAVTASGFTDGGWTDTVPGSNTFSFAGDTDVSSLMYQRDSDAWQSVPANATGDATLPWTPTAGRHTLTVLPIDKAGNAGTTSTFSFGVGEPAFGAPTADGRSTSQFPIELTGRPDATGAVLQWRKADATEWQTMAGVKTTTGTAWSGTVSNTVDGTATRLAGLVWDAAAQKDPDTNLDPDLQTTLEAPALLELRGCFSYATGPLVCGNPRRVQLVPSGFGANMPVTGVGPAMVALSTGEFTLAQGDAADAAAGVGRMFASFDPATLTGGVFGPGWSSLVADPTTDAASAELVDNRAEDGSMVLLYPDASTTTFILDTGTGRYLSTDPQDTRTLTLDDPVTPTTATLREDQGPTTVWASSGPGWLLDHVTGPVDSGTTSYERDGQHRLVWIAQGAPAGVACDQTTSEPGCRGLKLVYDANGLVASVQRVAYDPKPGADGLPGAGAGMVTTTVADYTYTDGLLTRVCDPRADANNPQAFCTTYTYTTSGGRTLLATVTPPAQAAWRFGYDNQGRIETVKRALDPDTNTGTGDATWTVAYDIDPDTTGLPDLSDATAQNWGQSVVPVTAAAVFGPNHVPAATPAASDWPYASLWYTDQDNVTSNTASYGAGQWLVDTTWYDADGNTVQTLDGAGRARALAAADPNDSTKIALEASTLTQYSGNDNGNRVTDEYSPAHTATLRDGTTGRYRAHTHYVYDDQAPTLDPARPALEAGDTSFDLVMEEQHSAAEADLSADHDTQLTRNEYSPNVAGDGDGWLLGIPTRTLTQTETGWAVTHTRFDPEGRQIETRQPGGHTAANGAGDDAHSITFDYYSADGTAADPECRNRPAWDGLPCRVGPAAQPATGPTMPTTYTTGYNTDQQPTRVEDRSSGTTRVTTTSYDDAGRPVTTHQTITGGDPADPTSPTTTIGYATNGQPDTQTAGGDTITTGYDTWGRAKTYTDATGLTSTTTYTTDSQVATFNDGAGTYTYTYDNTGEHRRLPTSVDVGLATGPDVFTLDYNPAGAQSKVTYPNGLEATYQFDELGIATSLDYATAGQDILGFTATLDVDGRTVASTSTASAQDYTYDLLGRLATVQDTRDNGCTTRVYGFSAASERTSLTSYTADPATGACQTTTPAYTKSSSYDTANRITNTGYTYDNLGRTHTTPATDTNAAADPLAGPLSATYHPNDMIGSLTQTIGNGAGGTTAKTTTYGLDPTGRIATITNKADSTETKRIRYRYSGNTDSPTLVDTSDDTGATWTPTRYIQTPGIGMSGALTGNTLTLQLANLHGDTIATQTNTPGANTTASHSESDEYGNPLTGTLGRYGWLGSHQRSNDTLGGLTLMGARLYNPTTGLFASIDPVLGGGATRYAYPTDPVNMMDLNGEYWWGAIHTWYANPFHPLAASHHWWNYKGRKISLHLNKEETRNFSYGDYIAYFYFAEGVTGIGLSLVGAPHAGVALALLLWAYHDQISSKASRAVDEGRTIRITFYLLDTVMMGYLLTVVHGWIE